MKTMILFVCLAIAIAIPLIQGSCSTAPVKIRQTGRSKYIGMSGFVCTSVIIMHVFASYFVFSFASCRFILIVLSILLSLAHLYVRVCILLTFKKHLPCLHHFIKRI